MRALRVLIETSLSGSLLRPYSGRPLPLLSVLPSPASARWLIRSQSRRGRTIKRAADIAFSLAVLVLASPLYLALALLVNLTSPGPVFYVQRRIGRGYRSFGCIKFRTMHVDADRTLQAVLADSPELRQEFERDFKLKRDPRITPIGSFLRRSSLDELPQFINVLLGHMSVVGPRPIVKAEMQRYGSCVILFPMDRGAY